jgi:hypothetical protein
MCPDWFSRSSSRPVRPQGKIVLAAPPIIHSASSSQRPTLDACRSISELIADGRLDTALQRAETDATARPGEFDAWRQRLEIRAFHAVSVKQAERIFARIDANPNFSPEQKQRAEAILAQAKADQHKLV